MDGGMVPSAEEMPAMQHHHQQQQHVNSEHCLRLFVF
jgi:hypothetical protein